MTSRRKWRHRRRLVILFCAVILALGATTPLCAQAPAQLPVYQRIAKWQIHYSDAALGMVEGVAYCSWKGRHCTIIERNPQTNALSAYISTQMTLPDNAQDPVIIKDGPGPFVESVAAPPEPALIVNGADGDKATIIIKYRNATFKVDAPVRKNGRPTGVTLNLAQQPDGSLFGGWSYLANPITERDNVGGVGETRVGYFDTVPDQDLLALTADQHSPNVAFDPGGFLGRQNGDEFWQPLPPRIFGVMVLEDQAAFNGAAAYYPRRPAGLLGQYRHLVVIGRDLPVQGRSLIDPESTDDALNYTVYAVAGDDRLTDEAKQDFERAFKTLTKGMTADEAAAFRKLDAALVNVGVGNIDPGKKTFTWGTATVPWDLQYGDNTADVRLKRVFNDTDSDIVQQLALPDRVVVEVTTGSKLDQDTIPVQIDGPGISGGPIALTASRDASNPRLYRTAPVLFLSASDHPAAPAPGASAVLVQNGTEVEVNVDRANTSFLRASTGIALAERPSTLWLDALKRAAQCNNASFNDGDWPSFAKQPSETVSRWGQSITIDYGDHAAMLILRDAFVQMMQRQITELNAAAADDGLVDAWYRIMHDAITEIPDYPLAGVDVPAPSGGTTAFRNAYSENFAEQNFHLSTTANGMDNYLKWRRAATRATIASFAKDIADATIDSQKIADCDRLGLLKLTGSGFANVSTRTTPLLMKLRPGSDASEPDFIARAYVKNLDQVAGRIATIKEFGKEVNKAVITVALVTIPPLAQGVWTVTGIVGEQGVGVLAGLVSGLAVFSYDSAHLIYDTYQQHEEVRRAFAYSAAIGLARYFDTQAKSSPWWQTGATIFGQGLLQALLTPTGPISETISAWRGARIVAALPKGEVVGIYRAGALVGSLLEPDLAALRKLPIGDQFNVGMFLFKEEERLATIGVAGEARQFSDWVFRALGQEAVGQVPAAEQAVTAEATTLARKIEMEALDPLDDYKAATPPPDPLREAKWELSDAELAARLKEYEAFPGRAEEILNVAPMMENLVAESALPTMPKPWPQSLKLDLPKPGVPWKATLTPLNATQPTQISFDVESFLAEGGFSRVYKLRSLPNGLGIVPQEGKTYVMKIIQHPAEIQSFERLPAVKQNIIQRMITGRDLLRAAKIPQADFQAYSDAGILIQEYLPFAEQPDKFALVPKMTQADVENPAAYWARLGTQKMEAIAQLFSNLGDARIAMLDAHHMNIYLEQTEQGWVAKVLDQDFIIDYAHVTEGVYGEFSGLAIQDNMTKIAWSTFDHPELTEQLYAKPRSFMQMIMEHQGWLHYNYPQHAYGGAALLNDQGRGLLDPQVVKKVMPDLHFVPTPAPPPLLAPPVTPLKGGWLAPSGDAASRAANDNLIPGMKRASWNWL